MTGSPGAAVCDNLRKTRVLLVLPSLHAGGAENYALRLIRFAGEHEFEWHVLSPNLERGDLHDAFEEAGANVRYQRIGYASPLKIARFYRYLKDENFDVVCTLNGVFGGLTLAIAKLAGVHSRIGWHRRSTPAFKPTWARRVYSRLSVWLLEKSATRILSNGHAALDHFHGAHRSADKRFGVIPNGVDAGPLAAHYESKEEARAALGISRDECVVGHVGRYDPAKNHLTIFRVAVELIAREPRVKFVFCGRGTDSPEFGRQLDHFGIATRCIALGLQTNLPRVYHSFDVFYFPSVTEGQPNALIEAILAKVPFVASDIPGIREVVPLSVHAALLPPMAVEPAVKAILAQLHPSEDEAQVAFEWALDRFDLARNMTLSLQTLQATPVQAPHA